MTLYCKLGDERLDCIINDLSSPLIIDGDTKIGTFLPLQANSLIAKEITNAQFYYLDKFILLTSGNILCLYKYHIDSGKPDDIKR